MKTQVKMSRTEAVRQFNSLQIKGHPRQLFAKAQAKGVSVQTVAGEIMHLAMQRGISVAAAYKLYMA